jgi:hypothetical protein
MCQILSRGAHFCYRSRGMRTLQLPSAHCLNVAFLLQDGNLTAKEVGRW